MPRICYLFLFRGGQYRTTEHFSNYSRCSRFTAEKFKIPGMIIIEFLNNNMNIGKLEFFVRNTVLRVLNLCEI